MIQRCSLLVLLLFVLVGCPQAEDRCADDPSRCDSNPDEFSLNSQCLPSGPLTVTIGEGEGGVYPFESAEDMVVHFGSQGGTHTFLGLQVEGVDVEKSPLLRVSLNLFSFEEHGAWECVAMTPSTDWEAPDYMLFYKSVDAGEGERRVPSEQMVVAQSGCTSRGCGEGQLCELGIGCVPSLCFVGDEVIVESNQEIHCALDCAGGMCVDEAPAALAEGCGARACGNDGQGGTCGACAGQEVCSLEGQCVESCPNEDACGAYCTPCPADLECVEGHCGLPDAAPASCVALNSRLFVVGGNSPLEVDGEGTVSVQGIIVFDPQPGLLMVRVEDQCGNVGQTVLP